MNKSVAALLTLLVPILFLAAADDEKPRGPQKAVAVIHHLGMSKVHGMVEFTQEDGYIHITGEISGLTPGKHGFHVHEFGDCSKMDGSCAGGHFNPTKMPHGGPDDEKRHVGDLGNIEANEDGKATIDMKDKVIQLHGPSSIIGRGIIVHEKADDLKTQPTGNAGGRVGCGVVGIAGPTHAK